MSQIQHGGRVLGAVYSPNENQILSWSIDGTARLWDTLGNLRAVMQPNMAITGAAYSADASRIITWSENGPIHFWRSNGDSIKVLHHEDRITKVYCPPNANRFITLPQYGMPILWDFSGKKINELPHYLFGVTDVVFSTDASRILTKSIEGARLWDSLGNRVGELSLENKGFDKAIFSPDASQIIIWSGSGLVRLFDKRGKKVAEMQHEITETVLNAVFSPDGNKILILFEDGKVHLWNINTNTKRMIISFEKPFKGITSSSNGAMTLTWSSDGTAQLWNKFHDMIAVMQHKGMILGAKFSPSGRKILTWSNNGNIRLWLTPESIISWLKNAPFGPISKKNRIKYQFFEN